MSWANQNRPKARTSSAKTSEQYFSKPLLLMIKLPCFVHACSAGKDRGRRIKGWLKKRGRWRFIHLPRSYSTQTKASIIYGHAEPVTIPVTLLNDQLIPVQVLCVAVSTNVFVPTCEVIVVMSALLLYPGGVPLASAPGL